MHLQRRAIAREHRIAAIGGRHRREQMRRRRDLGTHARLIVERDRLAATVARRPDHLPALAAQPGREAGGSIAQAERSEEHTSELQSLMRISYAVFCLKKKKKHIRKNKKHNKNIVL